MKKHLFFTLVFLLFPFPLFAQGGADTGAVTLHSLFEVEGHADIQEELGSFVKGVGDLNKDGFMDVAVSAPKIHETWIYYGRVTVDTSVKTILNGGGPIAGGDLNGDGNIDVVVKNSYRADDTVFVYLGTPTGISTPPGVVLVQEDWRDEFGSALGIADLNGDGFDELIIGTPQYPQGSTRGKIYIYGSIED